MSIHAPTNMWALGLHDTALASIHECAGSDCQIVAKNPTFLTDLDALKKEAPQLIWISLTAWKQYLATHEAENLIESIPFVLVLDETYNPDDSLDFLEFSFFDILRSHTASSKICSILSRALEAHNVCDAITHMSREISLDRELLERKIKIFDFLQTFITDTASCTNKKNLFLAAKKNIALLLPLKGLHLGIWKQTKNQSKAHIYLDCANRSEAHTAWGTLLSDIVQLSGPHGAEIELSSWSQSCPDTPPNPQHMLILPLRAHDLSLGIVVLDLKTWQPLGKDQSQALDAAILHFSSLIQCFILQAQSPGQATYTPCDTYYQQNTEQHTTIPPASAHSL